MTRGLLAGAFDPRSRRRSDEDNVAFRDGLRYVARLERCPPPRAARGAFAVRGRRDLHRHRGARRHRPRDGALARPARGPPPPPPRANAAPLPRVVGAGPRAREVRPGAASPRSSVLEALGARVESAAVDVAAEGALERCLDARRTRGEPGPCGGAIHAAALVQFKPLATEMTPRRSTPRWPRRSPARGASITSWASRRSICSSSARRRPRSSGRRSSERMPPATRFSMRLPTTGAPTGSPRSVWSWGTGGEVGMAVESTRSKGGGLLVGMTTISTARGLAALGALLDAGVAHAAVTPIDWNAPRARLPRLRHRSVSLRARGRSESRRRRPGHGRRKRHRRRARCGYASRCPVRGPFVSRRIRRAAAARVARNGGGRRASPRRAAALRRL